MLSNKKHTRKRRNTELPLEPLFRGVREALFHDIGDEHIRRYMRKNVRGQGTPINDGAPPYAFKRFVQCMNFDKRVIWKDDKSFKELSAKSLQDFVESQETFNVPEPLTRRAQLVVQLASQLCAEILGPFDRDYWLESCAFGKRSAVELPRSKSYLDARFDRISGTPLQLNWFNEALSRDIHLLRAVRKRCRQRKALYRLSAKSVPKSYKAARIMFPDTILGGYFSRGLGDYIRHRLEKGTKIDLAKQQERHRRWARRASLTGRSATIDLSKASDSFVRRHIELLVPVDWHEALDVCIVNRAEVDGVYVPLKSVLLMGSSVTFPLQTLLFYCLAKATQLLLEREGTVSVYGDDIIVPMLVAHPLIAVMSDLGFTVNSEKSFYDLPDRERPSHTFFRESCGGDYKGGVDVRPYMPECDLQSNANVPRNEYVSWCHKMINGLLNRWESCEVTHTIGFLLREISKCKASIHLVPTWETDHSGIKFYLPDVFYLGFEVTRTIFQYSTPSYQKLAFHEQKRERKVDERPYYWYKLYSQKHAVKVDPRYDSPVSLDGEPRRDLKGTYRWQHTAKDGCSKFSCLIPRTRSKLRGSSTETP